MSRDADEKPIAGTVPVCEAMSDDVEWIRKRIPELDATDYVPLGWVRDVLAAYDREVARRDVADSRGPAEYVRGQIEMQGRAVSVCASEAEHGYRMTSVAERRGAADATVAAWVNYGAGSGVCMNLIRTLEPWGGDSASVSCLDLRVHCSRCEEWMDVNALPIECGVIRCPGCGEPLAARSTDPIRQG